MGKFWKWSTLTVNLAIHPEQKQMLIHSSRLAVVPKMVISELNKSLVESLLQAITEGATPRLRVLEITLRVKNGPLDDAVDIDAGLLSRAVAKVEWCWIHGGNLSQMEAVFSAIIQSQDLALKHLRHEPAVQDLSPDVMAAAAVKLEGLALCHSTEAQVAEVLTRLGTTQDSKLRVLKLGSNVDYLELGFEFDISHLSPDILIRSLLKLDLDILGLNRFKFSAEQIFQLFTNIRDSNLKLTHLCLELENSLSQVPPQLVASAFSRLESVELHADNGVSAEQFSAIFNMLASQELDGSKLKYLDIQFIAEEFSTISPGVLVEGIRRLEEFELFYSILTSEQINAILTAVTEGRQGMLKTIKIKMLNEDILGTVSQTLLESAKQVKGVLEIEFLDEYDV